MTTAGSVEDLVDLIVEDHREVERVFAELEDRTADPQRRRDLADHVIAELVRHSVAEEEFMYPAARERVEGGAELADREIAEHAEAEQLMKELEGIETTEARFDELLGRLMAEIRHHVAGEENDFLPRLRAACDHEELVNLGEQVRQAKQIAPTRPHPASPSTPPANRLLDPGVGLIDRLRDKLSNRNA